MEEVRYISKSNYNPGREAIPAGTIFTEAQWVKCGGKKDSLKGHLDAGYITEAEVVVQVPPQPLNKPTPAPVVEETVTTSGEADEKEVIEPEPTVTASTKPSGIWDYTSEELEPLSLPVLNGLYKDRGAEFDLKVREYKDKDALIKKMTSQQAKD